jgi:hypothetical protein
MCRISPVQLLIILSLSDTTSKFCTVAMFVTIIHISCKISRYVYDTPQYKISLAYLSNVSLHITIKPKAKYRFYAAAMLLYYAPPQKKKKLLEKEIAYCFQSIITSNTGPYIKGFQCCFHLRNLHDHYAGIADGRKSRKYKVKWHDGHTEFHENMYILKSSTVSANRNVISPAKPPILCKLHLKCGAL